MKILSMSLNNFYHVCEQKGNIICLATPFSAAIRKAPPHCGTHMKVTESSKFPYMGHVSPSANPIWRIVVPYSVWDGNRHLAPMLRQRRCSLLYDVYWLAWWWLMFNRIKILWAPGVFVSEGKGEVAVDVGEWEPGILITSPCDSISVSEG